MSPAASEEPATLAGGPVRGVNVEEIERELAQLGLSPGEKPGDAPVRRACMSNLLVFARGAETESPLVEEIEPIVRSHPARVLLMVAGIAPLGNQLEAGVTALCYLGGGSRQICSENVTVRSGPEAERRLASVVRPLVIGDLPTTLWWAPPQPPLDGGGLFNELASMADHVLYDSSAWSDPSRGFASMARWALGEGRRVGLSDLAWTKTRSWRRLVAHAVQPYAERGVLAQAREASIDHGPNGATQAWLLAGWIASRLGWKEPRRETPTSWFFHAPVGLARLRVEEAQGESSRDLRAIRMKLGGEREPEVFEIHCEAGGRMALECDGTRRHANALKETQRAELVAAELPSLGKDAVERESLEMARQMLGSRTA